MQFLDTLFAGPSNLQSSYIKDLVLPLLVAFIVGQLSAWCYQWTHRGVSYSRTFTQSLVLMTLITSLTMCMVKTNPIAAFGLLGGLAIIRYRTAVRDARDTAYVLLCIVCGMAAGFGFSVVAIFGCLAANLVAVYLHVTAFGSRYASESLLRFQAGIAVLDSPAIVTLLKKYCRRYSVISVDEITGQGPGEGPTFQCAYKLRLRDSERVGDFVAELRANRKIGVVHLLAEQENEDIA